jgi:hypothetical protein
MSQKHWRRRDLQEEEPLVVHDMSLRTDSCSLNNPESRLNGLDWFLMNSPSAERPSGRRGEGRGGAGGFQRRSLSLEERLLEEGGDLIRK